ncbi:beta-galactosidase [Ascidiaceihabitans sp.]|uniref:beta-galactosidase n=1 Tax=Ascidiaceihabitans sp. TaxID=1872644 RepID=UPI0032979C8F
MIPELGVCYYPEHWDEAMWAEDAARMVETGITWVRIAEFAWSRLEPVPGHFAFEWLDKAIGILAGHGLKVVLCTPTATPPRWMIDRYPDMLAVDGAGQPRTFGSRRHYCFSHLGYRAESVRIAQALGERYGRDPRIHAWQIDNEYGCHDTVISYSDHAKIAFQGWCAQRYGDIEALNTAWGNVFWSMEYTDFDQIALPHLTVTQPNPAHELAFRRFSSDQVTAYNRAQAQALRHATDAPLIHNYMGRILEFDHFEVGADLDIASWDSYPIGFLSDRLDASEAHKAKYLQQGDPDMQAFHHDLYRSVGKGRWWVMEQQPGPVNWAPYNPAPLEGMVRLWTWEAIAHGAEVVSYFRWRQAPFAQEQMHAGLLTPQNGPAPGMTEAAQVAREIGQIGAITQKKADAALVFDYASDWCWTTLPQGADFTYFRLVLEAYKALRRAGRTVDILPATAASFDGYDMVLAPGLAQIPDSLKQTDSKVVLGPRTGTVTEELRIPTSGTSPLPQFSESLPPDHKRSVQDAGHVVHWQETWDVADNDQTIISDDAGKAVLFERDGQFRLAAWPDETLWDTILEHFIAAKPTGDLRVRTTQDHIFVINYTNEDQNYQDHIVKGCDLAIFKDGTRIL